MILQRKNCVIRADGSLTLGGGHIYRCLVLADALTERGWRCHFAIREETLGIVPKLGRLSHKLIVLDGNVEDEPHAIACHFASGIDLLVVDHYFRDEPFERALRNVASRILVIEDLVGRNHCCDILFDQTNKRRPADSGALTDRLNLLGCTNALVRPSFARRRLFGEARPRSGQPRHILIQAGASDPCRLALPLAAMARTAFPESRMDIVLGSSSPSLDETAAFAAAHAQTVRLHVDSDHMDGLMSAADLMVGAAGSSCWEACCLGLPSVLVRIADNQRPVVQGLTEEKAALFLGDKDDFLAASPQERLARLDPGSLDLELMSLNARRLCDGLGVRRLLLALEPEIAKRNQKVRLRPVTPEDSPLIFAWQQNPATRRYFRNKDVPTKEGHEKWFSQRIVSNLGPYCLVLADETPAGTVRLDRVADRQRDSAIPAFEVSLVTAPDQRGQGIGTAALRAARRLVPEADMVAYIEPANTASIRSFEMSGFQRDGGDWMRLFAGMP